MFDLAWREAVRDGAGGGRAAREPPRRRRRPRALRSARRCTGSTTRTARGSTSCCCRTPRPSTRRASAPSAPSASSTNGSISARPAWRCTTTPACWCAATAPSSRSSATRRCCWPMRRTALQRAARLAARRAAPRPRCRAPSRSSAAAWIVLPDGRRQRLRALRARHSRRPTARCAHGRRGRPLARGRARARAAEIGALMNTAGVGVATWEPRAAGSRSRMPRARKGGRPGDALQAISRDLVEPESLPEYERLQRALKDGERAEVRYAVRHPELGRRWLLTRVEPAELAGRPHHLGRHARRHRAAAAQQRSEQLLRELTTILESTTAGIAYLRGDMLVRCNRRFEAMLRLPAGTARGRACAELFARHPNAEAIAAEMPRRRCAPTRSTRPSSRRATPRAAAARPPSSAGMRCRCAAPPPAPTPLEAIAVLSDITRLKAQQAELEMLARDRELMARRTRAILDSVLVGIVTVGAARHRVDEPLGAPHVRRRPGRLHRPADRAPWRRPSPTTRSAAAALPARARRRAGRDLRVPACRRATGASSGSSATRSSPAARRRGRQLTYALLDIERRRQAEARIAQAQASLQRIIEAAPLAIALRRRAQRCACCRSTRWRRAASRRSTPTRWSAARREEMFDAGDRRPSGARDMEQALRRPRADAARVPRRARRRDARLGRALPAARRRPGAAARPAAARGHRRHRAARRRSEARFEAAIAQREMLVKEVHHRIKNNLQGVAGLLQQIAQRKPEVAPVSPRWSARCRRSRRSTACRSARPGRCASKSVVEAITGSVQRTFGRPITLRRRRAAPHRWALPEAESIPIALTVNELLTNAVKHGDAGARGRCAARCVCGDDGVRIEHRATAAQLPAGFEPRARARRRVGPRPGARAAAAPQRDASTLDAGRRRRWRRSRSRRPASPAAGAGDRPGDAGVRSRARRIGAARPQAR